MLWCVLHHVFMRARNAAVPPYWRRNLPIGDTTVIPSEELARAFSEYAPATSAAGDYDTGAAARFSSVGGDQYSTLAQLTYRQVQGALALAYHPVKVRAVVGANSCLSRNRYPHRPSCAFAG